MTNVTKNFEKSVFVHNQLKHLGYVIDSNGLHVDPAKIDCILNYPTPKNKKEVERFLVLLLTGLVTIAGPLTKLTSTIKKSNPFIWCNKAEAFTKLKELLVSAPILSCPNFDLPFGVHTDASDYVVGGLLTRSVLVVSNIL
ncbi:unnamed protein product [Euphydryas editha]|uniref:Reverse transcriptase/retrotransposon-derived protein RNase H-like domain-containing protein n=1 Tax=Euphydryas editha TaxID=104508 RepID=A0AAU9TME2_EUPED|nr:unnamed protein product [Euphydryas editha]